MYLASIFQIMFQGSGRYPNLVSIFTSLNQTNSAWQLSDSTIYRIKAEPSRRWCGNDTGDDCLYQMEFERTFGDTCHANVLCTHASGRGQEIQLKKKCRH